MRDISGTGEKGGGTPRSRKRIPKRNPSPNFRQWSYLLAPQHFLYFWPLPHGQGAFGLGFFPPVGLVNAWRGSLRMISSTRRRASVAWATPCADASAKSRRASG